MRECGQCGAEFSPARSTARFCSAKCRVAYGRKAAGVAVLDPVEVAALDNTEVVAALAAAKAGDRSELVSRKRRSRPEPLTASSRVVFGCCKHCRPDGHNPVHLDQCRQGCL